MTAVNSANVAHEEGDRHYVDRRDRDTGWVWRAPRRATIGALSGEAFGTGLLIVLGLGVEASVFTSPDGSMGDHDSVAWGWGLAVTMAVYLSARLSGAHLNPAVTLALAVAGRFPWRLLGPYIVAQALGAFVGAAIVRVLYADLIAKVDPEHTMETQDVFSTLPGNGLPGVSIATAVGDQVLGTAILVLVIFALTTTRNDPPLANLEPFIVGLLVVVIGMSWGANAGYAINPARDFAPRVLSLLTGYETAMLDQNGFPYWWVPIVGPLAGGVLAAVVFRFAIEQFLPAGSAEQHSSDQICSAAAAAHTSNGNGDATAVTGPLPVLGADGLPIQREPSGLTDMAANHVANSVVVANPGPVGEVAVDLDRAAAAVREFAKRYLTWNEDDPWKRGYALADFVAGAREEREEVAAELLHEGWDGCGRQEIAAPLETVRQLTLEGGRAQITVRVLVTRYERSESPEGWQPHNDTYFTLDVTVAGASGGTFGIDELDIFESGVRFPRPAGATRRATSLDS